MNEKRKCYWCGTLTEDKRSVPICDKCEETLEKKCPKCGKGWQLHEESHFRLLRHCKNCGIMYKDIKDGKIYFEIWAMQKEEYTI